MSTPKIGELIERARERGRSPDAARGRLRRIVVRVGPAEVDRLDALLAHFPESTRASLIRAYIALGLRLAEEHVGPKQDEGSS